MSGRKSKAKTDASNFFPKLVEVVIDILLLYLNLEVKIRKEF